MPGSLAAGSPAQLGHAVGDPLRAHAVVQVGVAAAHPLGLGQHLAAVKVVVEAGVGIAVVALLGFHAGGAQAQQHKQANQQTGFFHGSPRWLERRWLLKAASALSAYSKGHQ